MRTTPLTIYGLKVAKTMTYSMLQKHPDPLNLSGLVECKQKRRGVLLELCKKVNITQKLTIKQNITNLITK